MYKDRETTVANYFMDVYKKPLIKDQPLLQVKNGPEFIYLPPELCLLDGVETSVKKSRKMRDVLKMI